MSSGTEYYSLVSKRWRAILYDYERLAVNSDQQRLYCLTDFQVAWIRSNLDYYTWLTRWENTNATQKELDIQRSALELSLMSCLQLQPSQVEYIYNQAIEADLLGMNTAFDSGGIPELNPNTPTDFFSGDDSQDRLDALCSACEIYIRTYASNWITKAQIALGIVVVVGILASISIVGGVIASVLVGGLALITQTGLDAMRDEDAISAVICCMKDALTGTAVTSQNFEDSLDSCGFGVGTNEAIVRDIIATDMNQFDNYLSFLNSLGDSYVLSQAGVFVCSCGDPYEVNWLNGFGNPLIDGWVADTGTYNGGTEELDWGIVSASSAGIVIRYVFSSETTITKIEFKTRTFMEASSRQSVIQIFDEFDVLQESVLVVIDSTPNNQTTIVTLESISVNVNTGWYLLAVTGATRTAGVPTGTAFMEELMVRGVGDNPF